MIKENKKLSIIVPVYNAEKYLHRCFESILDNGYENLEIIPVNDGSKDGSQTIIDEYKEKYPKLEVVDYEIISFSPSKVVVDGLEDNEYYNVLISLEFNREVEEISKSANIVLVLENERFYVVGIDNA